MKSKFGSLMLSLLFAFGLWWYVITVVSPGSKQVYYNIPVVVEGEAVLLTERSLMITGKSTSTVTLELSGNRTDLAKINSSNITVKADVSKIYEPGTHSVSYNVTYPGNVASNAFVTESKSPEKLVYTVERRISKDVPVEVKWIGSAPDGFMSDRENRVLDYPYINISGPESVVDLIEKATIDVDLNEQRESISENYIYTLCNAEDEPVDAQLITTNVEEVHLDVKIQRVRDLPLTVALVDGGGATAFDANVSLSVESIRVSGSETALELLGEELVIGSVNLADVQREATVRFNINLPEGVSNRTGVTEVEATVRLTGLSTKEFTIQKIISLNVPEGMQADLITEKLILVVRGPAAQIAKLTVDSFTVTVDFTGAEIGTSTFRAIVTYAEGFESIGTLRIDSVSATLSQAEE